MVAVLLNMGFQWHFQPLCLLGVQLRFVIIHKSTRQRGSLIIPSKFFQYWRTIDRLNEQEAALDTLRWGADYLMKCHTERKVFYVQVSDKSSDEIYWGRAEDMKYDRNIVKNFCSIIISNKEDKS